MKKTFFKVGNQNKCKKMRNRILESHINADPFPNAEPVVCPDFQPMRGSEESVAFISFCKIQFLPPYICDLSFMSYGIPPVGFNGPVLFPLRKRRLRNRKSRNGSSHPSPPRPPALRPHRPSEVSSYLPVKE